MRMEVDKPPHRSSTKEELAELQPQQPLQPLQSQPQPQPAQRRRRPQEEPRRAAEFYDSVPLARSSSKESSRSDGSEQLPLRSPRSASSPSDESAPALAVASSKEHATALRAIRGSNSSSRSGGGSSGSDGGSTKWSRLFLTPKEEAQAAEQLGTNWTDVQWIFKLAYGASPLHRLLLRILAPSHLLPRRLSAHSLHIAQRHPLHYTTNGAHRALQADLSRE